MAHFAAKQVQTTKRVTCQRCARGIEAGEQAWMDWGVVTHHQSYSGRALEKRVPKFRHIECRQRFNEHMAEFDAETESQVAFMRSMAGLDPEKISAAEVSIRSDRAAKREDHAIALGRLYEVQPQPESVQASTAARALRAIPSEARSAASRENGKRGGRPRRSQP